MKRKFKKSTLLGGVLLFEFVVWGAAVWYDNYSKTQFNNEIKVELYLMKKQNEVIINRLDDIHKN